MILPQTSGALKGGKSLRLIRVLCVFALVALLVCSCSSPGKAELTFSENAMNATFSVRASGDVSNGEFEIICREAFERIKTVERTTDAADAVSDLCRFNSSDDGIDDAGAMFQELVSASLVASEATFGAYDPAMGSVTELWSRDREAGAPRDVRIEVALSHSGQELVSVDGARITKADEKLTLDLGHIRRGYALEEAMRCLDNSTLESGSLTLGETTCFFGEREGGFTYIARDDADREFARINVSGGFISRQKNDYDIESGFSSVIDPATGKAVQGDVRCAFVGASSGCASETMSYALVVLSSKRALEMWHKCSIDADVLIVTDDGSVYAAGSFADDGAVEITSPEYHLIRIKEK